MWAFLGKLSNIILLVSTVESFCDMIIYFVLCPLIHLHEIMSTDTVAQLEEHYADVLNTNPRSVKLFVCSVAFFSSILQRQNVGRSKYDRGLRNVIMSSHKNT